MKLSLKKMALIVAAFLFVGISATIAAGVWTTETTKIPIAYSDGAVDGTYNPADIRGSYTFAEVATLFEVPLNTLYQAFGIPSDTDGNVFKTKDLETLYASETQEIGNGSVQVFVALYKNLPIVLSDDYLPNSAIEILKALPTDWTPEERAYFETHGVDTTAVSMPIALSDDASSTIEDEEEEPAINGSTTFQQVLDMGISTAQIESIISGDFPPSNQTVKDYCTQTGLSFSEVKNAIIELLPSP